MVSALGVGTVSNMLVWVWWKGCFGCGDGDRDSPKAITVKGAMDGGWFGVVDVDVTIFGDFNTIVFVKDSGVACLCIIAQSDKGFIDRSSVASQLESIGSQYKFTLGSCLDTILACCNGL